MHFARSISFVVALVACTEPKSGTVPDDTDTTPTTTPGGPTIGTPAGGNGGGGATTTDDTDEPTGTEPEAVSWYFDFDGDGYGFDATVVLSVTSPGTDWVLLGGDCNDANASVSPGYPEVPNNGVDDDCDASTVDGSGPIDGDGDGFLSTVDCDDSDPDVNPAETEILGNGVDDDCDAGTPDTAGVMYWHYVDGDGDGYGAALGGFQDANPSAPVGFVNNDDDCDDTNSNKNPGEVEAFDGIDNDCDGLVDENGNGAAVMKTIYVTPNSTVVGAVETWEFFVLNDTTGDHDYWFDYLGFGGIGPFLSGVGTTTESADYEAMPGDYLKFNGWDSTHGNYLVGGCNTCVGAELCDLALQKCSYAEVDCGNGQVPTFSPNSYDLVCTW